MTMELLARRPVPPRPVNRKGPPRTSGRSRPLNRERVGAVPEYERHWRDGDKDQDTIAELQGQVAGLEGELRAARAQAQRLMRMVRAQQETVKQAREAGRAEGYEQREAEERAQVPPPRPRHDPADRWLRAVPAVALAALLTCRGLFTAARHSKVAAVAGHKLLLASMVPAATLAVVAALPAMHSAEYRGHVPPAAVRTFAPGSSGGPSPASWATPDPSGSPSPSASGSSLAPPSTSAAAQPATDSPSPTATDSPPPPGTPSPSPADPATPDPSGSPSPGGTDTAAATATPAPPDSPSPGDCPPAPPPAGT